MVFDKPQWRIKLALDIPDCNRVKGILHLCCANRKQYYSAIEVPPEAYLLVEKLMGKDYGLVYFYLDETRQGNFLFGMEDAAGPMGRQVDLWRMPASQIQDWMKLNSHEKAAKAILA